MQGHDTMFHLGYNETDKFFQFDRSLAELDLESEVRDLINNKSLTFRKILYDVIENWSFNSVYPFFFLQTRDTVREIVVLDEELNYRIGAFDMKELMQLKLVDKELQQPKSVFK